MTEQNEMPDEIWLDASTPDDLVVLTYGVYGTTKYTRAEPTCKKSLQAQADCEIDRALALSIIEKCVTEDGFDEPTYAPEVLAALETIRAALAKPKTVEVDIEQFRRTTVENDMIEIVHEFKGNNDLLDRIKAQGYKIVKVGDD